MAVLLLALALAAPAQAARLECQFETSCIGDKACEPAGDDAVLALREEGDNYRVTVNGEEALFSTVAGSPEDGLHTLVGGMEAGEGGAAMLSLYSDGQVVLTFHSWLFDPLTVTAFGSCTEAAE